MTTTPDQKQNVPSPIQRRSSPSVSVSWLNVDQVRARLRQAVERLVQSQPEIEEVWLFGPLALGDAVPGCDADLLVVLSGSQEAFLDRSVRYQPNFCGIGVDVLAYTRDEVTRMEAEGNRLLRQAMAEGICLFRRLGKADPADEDRDATSQAEVKG
jgi:predicted nucleotidyltransferase